MSIYFNISKAHMTQRPQFLKLNPQKHSVSQSKQGPIWVLGRFINSLKESQVHEENASQILPFPKNQIQKFQ